MMRLNKKYLRSLFSNGLCNQSFLIYALYFDAFISFSGWFLSWVIRLLHQEGQVLKSIDLQTNCTYAGKYALCLFSRTSVQSVNNWNCTSGTVNATVLNPIIQSACQRYARSLYDVLMDSLPWTLAFTVVYFIVVAGICLYVNRPKSAEYQSSERQSQKGEQVELTESDTESRGGSSDEEGETEGRGKTEDQGKTPSEKTPLLIKAYYGV